MVKDAASGTREWWTWSNVEQQEQEVDVKPLSRTAVADSILAVFPLRRRRCADNSARVVVVHRDDRVSIAMADNLENVLSEKRIIGDDRNTGRCVDTLRIEHAHLDESHPRYATLSVVFSTTCENGFGWCSVRLYDNDRFQEAPRVFALDMNHPSVSATKYASTDRKLALCNAHDGILRVFESTDTAVSAVFALPLLPAVLGTNASSSTIAAAATSLKIALCWISPDYLATIVSVEVGGQRRTLLRVVNIAFHFVQCERPFAGFEGIEDDAVFEVVIGVVACFFPVPSNEHTLTLLPDHNDSGNG